MSDPSPGRFSVGISAVLRETLRAEAGWARANGLLPEYLAALREVEYRLAVEPDEWGESREWLPELRVQMRCGSARLLTVLYGVAAEARAVFVKAVRVNRHFRPKPDPG